MPGVAASSFGGSSNATRWIGLYYSMGHSRGRRQNTARADGSAAAVAIFTTLVKISPPHWAPRLRHLQCSTGEALRARKLSLEHSP
jgi:hypothetical protein